MFDKHKHFLPYRHYVVCNLLLVLIPILAMVSLFLFNMHSQLRDEVLNMRRVNLERTRNSIDQTMENFGSMVLYASMDPDLRPYQLRQYNYEAVNALNHLKQHVSSLSEMQIYFHIYSDECLYSADGRSSFATFERLFSFEGGWTAEDFYALLRSAQVYTTSPAGCTLASTGNKSQSYIVVLYPWSHYGIHYGTAIGLIETAWLEKQLLGNDNDQIYLLDSSGEFLIGSMADEFPFEPTVVANRPDSAFIDGQRYYLLWQDSPLNGWSYLTALPASHVTSLLFGGHTLLFAFVFLLTLAFATMGVILAVRFYMPIQNLEQMLSHDPDDSRQVHDRISHILRSNESMRLELEETHDYLAQELYAQLIWGHLSQTECDARLRKFGFSMPGPVHAALTVSLGINSPPHVREAALSLLQSAQLPATESHSGGDIVVLYSGNDLPHFADGLANRILERLSCLDGLYVQLGVGQPCASITELDRSFIESVAALRHDTSARVIYFDELVEFQSEQLDKLVGYQRLRLAEIIRQGDAEAAEQACSELSEGLQSMSSRTDPTVLQFTVNGILNELLPVFREASLANIAWKVNLAIHTVQLDQFIAHLRPLCIQAAQAFAQKRDLWCNQRTGDILQYVNEHYDEHELSLSSIASLFDMTTSSLSRLFSDSTGMRFIDYISQKRMDQATQLLANTDLGISEIMTRVGYVDASSFTRKFTKMLGMSPSAYRKKSRESSGNKAKES